MISNSLNQIIKGTIDLDIINTTSIFENKLKKECVTNANIAINFNWANKTIEIDVGSKILDNYHSYRGGARLSIYLTY